jgi:RNA 3'-terminal phosphate cyclase (ATP)
MIHIDGSFGEGGGQIIRSSLALSLITGKAFRIDKIRAGREKPGLQNQHLMAVNAAAQIGQAEVAGATKGSRQLTFRPGKVRPGEYEFRIGTAGSTGLVLQTVLPPLLLAESESLVVIEGGTHNPWAPPFDFLEQTFLPVINSMGPAVTPQLSNYGFYPIGGGEVRFKIAPCQGGKLSPIQLLHRGFLKKLAARIFVVKLPEHIAEREADVLRRRIALDPARDTLEILKPDNCKGQGNYLTLTVESENIRETVTAIGRKGVRAEEVADAAVTELISYLQHDSPVGEHLADQLLLPFALAGGGCYRTGPLSLHTSTNIAVIAKFLDVRISTQEMSEGQFLVTIES